MSLQSMFNQMIGTIGVETSVLKNRLDKTAAPDKAEGPQKAVKGVKASETTNDTLNEPERKEGPSERPTKQKKKEEKSYTEEFKSYERLKKRVDTLKAQQKEYKERIKMLEGKATETEESTIRALMESYGGVL